MDDFGWNRMLTVIPLLQVRDVGEAIRYYQEVFGFTASFTWPNEEKPRWAMVSRDLVHIMLTVDLGTSTGEFIAEKGNGVVLYVIVQDVAALYDELVKREAIIVQELAEFGGRKQFSVADLNGYILAFSDPFVF
ncbi:MAG: VOC family protein [Chloroflexi bacterium]|nr:VOC family protein [Chloroflexota bacterium]